MGSAKNPITLSGHFGIDPLALDKAGVLDATLALDTKLFIDPLLFGDSKHKELRGKATKLYRLHFERIIDLLNASKAVNDAPWKAAKRLLKVQETVGTCLGYGAGSIHGSAIGETLANRILKVASEVIDVGVSNPALFSAMALFEEDIGPDRLSDLTTHIIFPALIAFNQGALLKLGMEGEPFRQPDGSFATFLRNPFEAQRVPIILVPTDILRDLPVARDWDEIAAAAQHNAALRERINQHVAEIWQKKTKRKKGLLKSQALASQEAFQTLLDSINEASALPYDVKTDPEGVIQWATKGRQYAENNPLQLKRPKAKSLDALFDLVSLVVDQFQHMIEECGLNKELYRTKDRPRHESTAQRLFFAIAYSYCHANDIDISPELDTGNGKVDFKFSDGFSKRVLVEIKLSTNTALVSGYTKQLEVYKRAQLTDRAIYLVLDVGKMGNKAKDLVSAHNTLNKTYKQVSHLRFVDGALKATASKRK